MLIFIIVGATAFACNASQGQCLFIDPVVMKGILGAGVLEMFFEGMFGFLKIYRKKE